MITMIHDNKINDEKIKINRVKAKSFLERKISVHILKTDREWWNGELLEVCSDFLVINERKKGRHTLFFVEIWDINELEEKK